MQGKIVKGIAGFYYVHVAHSGIYECKAKGIFRNQKIKPLVGDLVQIEILDEQKYLGNLISIEKRKNELIRPAVANIDQAIVIFALKNPMPNLNLLDRFLVMMESQGIDTIICFSKTDLVSKEEELHFQTIYQVAGYQTLFVSNVLQSGILQLKQILQGKTTVLAGPSGVGKSSLLNSLIPDANMATNTVSEKIQRGRHTTRHSELFRLQEDTYLMDTPGFSSLYVNHFEKEELKNYFPEFESYEGLCKYHGCVHLNEPDCAVKHALEERKISTSRYENYEWMYYEIKEKKKGW